MNPNMCDQHYTHAHSNPNFFMMSDTLVMMFKIFYDIKVYDEG